MARCSVDELFAQENELFYLNLALIEVRKVFYHLWKYPFLNERDMQLDEQTFGALENALAHDLGNMKEIELTDYELKLKGDKNTVNDSNAS